MNLQRYIEITNECQLLANEMETKGFQKVIELVVKGVRVVARAWSRSWIGYQSHVYYKDLQTPKPRDHFSSEWGFEEAFSNPTSSNWIEVEHDFIVKSVEKISVNPDLMPLRTRSAEISKIFSTYQSELLALLTLDLESTKSSIIEELRDKVKNVKAFYTADEIASTQLPQGQVLTRDSLALSQGLQVPPHIIISSELDSLSSSFHQIAE